MKPRIATITGTFGTEVQNGVGRFLVGLHEWSRDQGYPLYVFSPGEHVRGYPGVQDIHALSFPVPGGFKAIRAYYPLEGRRKQLRRALTAIDPDIVHLSTPDAVGTTGLWIARGLNHPVAGIYHTDFPVFAHHLVRDAVERVLQERGGAALTGRALGPLWQRLRPAYEARTRWWERWVLGFVARRVLRRRRGEIDDALRRAAGWVADAAQAAVREAMARFYSQFQLVIARSEVYREKLARELALPEDRVRTLRPGVDTRTFSPERTADDEGLRERLGLPTGARVVLYVGRVTDEKNVGFLADAWRAYRERHAGAGVTFAAVGSGNLEEFRRRAGPGAYALGPRHGGTLSAVYRLADVFWTASTSETLGQVVLEAQASGVPAVVSDRGAARENVRDGETRRVLAADSPARWAGELHALLGDGRRAAMGRAARAYAEARTIEGSYRHYWALHEELFEREGRHTRVRAGALQPGVTAPAEPAVPRGRPTLHLSDFHAGKRSRKIPKEAALRAACRRAAARGAKVFLHGDFLDTRPPLPKVREEVAAVRRAFDEFGVAPAVYVEGNHDYEFARAGRIEALLGCPVAPSLVHRDAETWLVITHGHVSELPGLREVMRAARSRDELIDALSADRLEAALELFALQYDAVGVASDLVEGAGLRGLEDAWRHSLGARRWLADRLMEAARDRSLDDRGVKALVHMIGSSDREQVLGQLCAALGGWGLVYGHTHEPHVTKLRVVDPLSGGGRTVLLGNCGSFRRKSVPPTWVEAAFPHMELWAYNAGTGEAELVDRVTLLGDEALPYEGPLPDGPAGPAWVVGTEAGAGRTGATVTPGARPPDVSRPTAAGCE
jgi:glycosyltransferase involved in cell wall biosynthesis/UDP-2,3-diacylglucosamine pyrophosphatase LpxH